MRQTGTRIDPLTTVHVLQTLGLAIDEIKLMRAIESINEQVRAPDAEQLESGRHGHLVSELRFLHKRLQSIRDKAGSC